MFEQRNGTATVSVTGGTIASKDGAAIYLGEKAYGETNVSGDTTLLTTASASSNVGAITCKYIDAMGDFMRLSASGGVVQNTALPEGWSIFCVDPRVPVDVTGGSTVGRVGAASLTLTAANTMVTKTPATKSYEFELTDTVSANNGLGELLVYGSAAASEPLTDVTAAIRTDTDNNIYYVTLSSTGDDLAPATYYVANRFGNHEESIRLALTVLAEEDNRLPPPLQISCGTACCPAR